MLSKFDLDAIRAALDTAKASASLKTSSPLGLAATEGLAALDRLIERERHCGFANYETFLVKLHIDNSRGTLADALQLARDYSNEGCDLADALKDYVETWTQAGKSSTLAGDLIGAALGSVDWRELADELAGAVAEGVTA